MDSIDKLLKDIRNNRTSNSCSIADGEFVDIDLSNLRANELHMENVSLLSVNLSKIHWRNCEIVNACLDKANLNKATVRLCKFINVSFNKASFNNATIENCELAGCDFEEATLKDASITDSDFNRSNFKGANLTNTNASYCNMRGVDFRGAILVNTDFRDADLRGADFSGANLQNANFNGADLRGAIFEPGVMDEEEQDKDAIFSPQMQELVDAAGPYLTGILNAGVNKNLIPTQEQEKLLQQLQDMLTVSIGNKSEDQAKSNVVELLLKRAGTTGIGSLIDALHSKSDEPSEAVADLINNLAKDLNLKENDTADDLLEKIVKSIK